MFCNRAQWVERVNDDVTKEAASERWKILVVTWMRSYRSVDWGKVTARTRQAHACSRRRLPDLARSRAHSTHQRSHLRQFYRRRRSNAQLIRVKPKGESGIPRLNNRRSCERGERARGQIEVMWCGLRKERGGGEAARRFDHFWISIIRTV